MEKLISIIKGIRYASMALGFLAAVVLLAKANAAKKANETKKLNDAFRSVKRLSFICAYFELVGWLSFFLESWQEHDIMTMILSVIFFTLFATLTVLLHIADACLRKRERDPKWIHMKEEQENE